MMSPLMFAMIAVMCLGACRASVYLGDEPIHRQYVDHVEELVMVPNIDEQSSMDGVVTGFQYRARNTNLVTFSIWRRVSGEDFQYIGGVDVTPPSSGTHEFSMSQQQYIHIQVGDIIGITWMNTGVIDFGTTSCNHQTNSRLIYNPTGYSNDQVVTFDRLGINSWGPCRHYSVRAIIEPVCAPGQYSSNGVMPCHPCPVGSYASGVASTTCQDCHDGYTTLSAGSTDSSNCYNPGSAIQDPHFMITDPITKEHLCFDYAGRSGETLDLVSDDQSGVYVTGKLFAPLETDETVTYFGDIEFTSDESIVTFSKSSIIVNGVEVSWNNNQIYASEDVVLRPLSDRAETMMVELSDGGVSVVVNRNNGEKTGKYLGIYVAHVDGLSEETEGVIGQFVHSNFVISEDNQATISLFRGEVTVPVRSTLRFSPTAHGKLSCWLYESSNDSILLSDKVEALVYGGL